MTARDKATIKERLDKDQVFIKSQHRLPKRLRDERKLTFIRARAKRLTRWLSEKDS